MPRFASLCARGALVTDVAPVCLNREHTLCACVVTGRHPRSHGVTHNRAAPRVAGRNLYAQARKESRSVYAIGWPTVTRGEVHRFIPCATEKPRISSLYHLISLLRHGGAAKAASPDAFALCAARDAVLRHKPGLLLLGLAGLLRAKQDPGKGVSAISALEQCDKHIGTLIDSVWAAGTADITDYIIFGGGAGPERDFPVDLNAFLGSLREYGGFHAKAGCSFFKYHTRTENPALHAKAARVIGGILENPDCGRLRLLTEAEMDKSGFAGEYEIGIEPLGTATSGFYLAAGANVPHGLRLTGGSMLDICPLALRLSDMKKWAQDGCLRADLLL